MADRYPPLVPFPLPDSRATGTVETGGRSVDGAGREEGRSGRGGVGPGSARPDRGDRWRAVAIAAPILAAGLILAFGVAALVGDAVRRAVLVQVDRDPAGARPAYSDAPAEAAAFFSRRDTVRVRVPRDMTVAEFLSLYHLDTHASARAALRDQLGAVAGEDVLVEGDRVTFTVTVPRRGR